jgi:hypothetical protein
MSEDIETLRTELKLRVHAEQDAKPATRIIKSNQSYKWSGIYHLGVRRELRYERTGLIQKVYYVTRCNGKILGGSWGQTEMDEWPAFRVHRCERCFGLVQGGYK